MSRRRPSQDDDRLWAAFTKTIKPLKPQRVKPAADVTTPIKPSPAKTRVEKAAPPPPSAPLLAPKPSPPITSLGRRERRSVATGKVAIEGRLDLHGHTQSEAHDALCGFLHRARGSGKRLVLVITGKSGVLRRQVPLWLEMPDMRDIVLGVDQAHVAHGGEGALYVRIRRARSRE